MRELNFKKRDLPAFKHPNIKEFDKMNFLERSYRRDWWFDESFFLILIPVDITIENPIYQ